jgi:hypothetical protein
MININHTAKHLLLIIILSAASFPAFLKANGLSSSRKMVVHIVSDSIKGGSSSGFLLIEERKKIPDSGNPQQINNNNIQAVNYPLSLMLDDGTIWRSENEIKPLRLLGMTGGVLAVGTVGYFRLKDLWYDHPTSKFTFKNFSDDLKILKQMDKYGHFLHAYFASDLASRLYRWSGFSGESSILYGTLTGWLWILQIEIADGFFEDWGFSWGDLIANTLGSGFSALQQIYPEALGGLQPKFSYTPSQAFKEKRYYTEAKSWIDDYEGITWWLGINVYHYLPEKVQKDYPGWLKPFGLAVGQSAKGIADSEGFREIFIGLDFDLRKISVGDNSGLVRFLKNEFNIIRLPMPAVRVTPGGIWYGLYF